MNGQKITDFLIKYYGKDTVEQFVKKIKIETEELAPKHGGYFDPRYNKIALNKKPVDKNKIERTCVHEMAHAMQIVFSKSFSLDKELDLIALHKWDEEQMKNVLAKDTSTGYERKLLEYKCYSNLFLEVDARIASICYMYEANGTLDKDDMDYLFCSGPTERIKESINNLRNASLKMMLLGEIVIRKTGLDLD